MNNTINKIKFLLEMMLSILIIIKNKNKGILSLA